MPISLSSYLRFIKIALTAALVFSVLSPNLSQKAEASGNWNGQYWNIPGDPEQSPEFPTGAPDFTRSDAEINFNWEGGSPDSSINDEGFAARWTATRNFEEAYYYFSIRVDDGVRMYIDGNLVMDEWYDRGFDNSPHTYMANMTAGSHLLVVEYYENGGGAGIILNYGVINTPNAYAVLGQNNFDTDFEDNVGPNNFGFADPQNIVVDSTAHRLYVADSGGSSGNRVLVFNLDSNNQLVDKVADYVIGQPNFNSRNYYCSEDATASGFCEPYGLAIDEANQRLFVSDEENSRILIFNVTTITNGMSASYVLGQTNFSSFRCNRDDSAAANTLCEPWDLDYDPVSKYLFAADADNSRVLVYDVTPGNVVNGMDAIHVFGQDDFETVGCNKGSWSDSTVDSFCYPLDVDYSDGALFVSDADNSRVMVFYTGINDYENGMDANVVLGQEDFTSQSCNQTGWNDVAADTLCYPRGVHYDENNARLFVVDGDNSRVVMYDLSSEGGFSGMDASIVLGQDNFTSRGCNKDDDWEDPVADGMCYPGDVFFENISNQLFVSDQSNFRVLIFDAGTEELESGVDAVDVIGQNNFTENWYFGISEPNSAGFDEPYTTAIDADNHRLFVSDRWNYRVLVFDLDSNNNIADKTADYVLGQPDFETPICNEPSISAEGLCEPFGLAYDAENERLFVSDKNNSRVLVYDVSPDNIEDGMSAMNVIGQPDFTTGDCNTDGRSAATLCSAFGLSYDSDTEYLYVADRGNNRVLGFDVAPDNIENGMAATRVLGQANFTSGNCNRGDDAEANTLCRARGVTVNSTTKQLFVADSADTNHRVLVYDVSDDNFANGMDADIVIGQENFNDTNCNMINDEGDKLGINTLCNPNGITVDTINNRLYVADEWNSRIMVFNSDPDELENTPDAIGVIGQATFEGDDCNWDNDDPSEYTICEALSLNVNPENGDLFVADTHNNRVLQFKESSLSFIPTIAEPVSDSDNDGISDAVEDAGPNGGDANNDGIPDSEQFNVSSFVNPNTNAYVVLEVSDICSISIVGMLSESENAVADAGFNYPAGMMSFEIDCGTAGFTATITQYYYGLSERTYVVRKYHSVNESYQSIEGAVVSKVTIAGSDVFVGSYQITDGGDLDEDAEENGIIVDPSALGISAVGAPRTGLGGNFNK